MKRTFAAALAAASVSGTMLLATPAFAASKPVTLHVKPSVVVAGNAVAISGKCQSKWAVVKITSPELGLSETGEKGKKLKVQLNVGSTVMPGKYGITAQCYTHWWPGAKKCKWLTVEAPPVPPVPPKPPKPIPHFKPDVIVKTGFGGMAQYVANHHPVG
jgi:hypothetical protein